MSELRTYLQTFQCTDRPSAFHGFRDLLVEGMPLVKRSNPEELNQRVKFLNTVLPGDHRVE